MKNQMKVNGNDLVLLVEKKDGTQLEYKFDVEDLPKLQAVKKSFYVQGQGTDLCYQENRTTCFVKDLILDFPKTRVSHIDGDSTNLRKSNLRPFGIRNVYYVEGDNLIVEINTKGEVVKALFDKEDQWLLHLLNSKLYLSNGGYVKARFKGKGLLVHRYLAEKHWGKKSLKGKVIDHVSGVKHDNRKSQLRVVTHAENNASKHRTSAKSGFPNVYSTRNGNYRVDFGTGNRFNKTFTDKEEACRYAYAVRPFSFDRDTYLRKQHETVGSIENLQKAISN